VIVSFSCVIVDDSPGFLDSASRLLEAEGATVLGTARNGRDALNLMSSLDPDVVLLDVELGDEDGIEVARVIAAQPNPPAVILISSRDRQELGELMQPGEVAGFLVKDSLSAQEVANLLTY
jgi:two-component system nitrate/nitrite response regulator NarL